MGEIGVCPNCQGSGERLEITNPETSETTLSSCSECEGKGIITSSILQRHKLSISKVSGQAMEKAIQTLENSFKRDPVLWRRKTK